MASLGLVIWAVVSRGFSAGLRRATMVVSMVLACGGWTLVRINGITGGAEADFTWRWTPTAEERLLALPIEPVASVARAAREELIVVPTVPFPEVAKPVVRWAGFRGPNRDSALSGVSIETD